MQENLNLESIPKQSGIYTFIDETGAIIYVGSSKNLFNRLSTHKRNITSKKEVELYKYLRENSFTVEVCLTDNYLQMEQDYIEKHQPHFNKNRACTGIDATSKIEYYRKWHEAFKEEHNLQMRAYDSAICFYEGEYMRASKLREKLYKLGVKNPSKESRKYIVSSQNR